MGIFDFFGKEPSKTRAETSSRIDLNKTATAGAEDINAPVTVFSPTSYADVEIIIDTLKMDNVRLLSAYLVNNDEFYNVNSRSVERIINNKYQNVKQFE